MTELLLPGVPAREPGESPFDRRFFVEHFHSDEPPPCDLYEAAEVPVVELELVNGTDPDVYFFEEFRRDYLVAVLFVDPPRCDAFFRSFIRYETIVRVNIRFFPSVQRKLGFKPVTPLIEEDPSEILGPRGSNDGEKP